MSDNRRLPRVLCYGDSLTAGFTARTQYTGVFSPWAPHVADALSVPVIHHVGMCGWKTAQMLEGLDSASNVDVCKVSCRGLRRLLEEGAYTHVLLMAGSNDLKTRSATEITESLQRLHSVCHAAGARTLALAIPHFKGSSLPESVRGGRRRTVNENLRAFAAGSGGWCDFGDPAEEEMEWEEGSCDFEADGLHLTCSGYDHFASLLLDASLHSSASLRDFLLLHEHFTPELPAAPALEEASWRRGMRHWMALYREAIESVQGHVYDIHMAKASAKELETLHEVLQAEGIAGLRAAIKALELKAMHRVLLDEGLPGLRAAIKASKRAKMATAKARARGLSPLKPHEIAKLAQTAFVPLVGVAVQSAAQALRADPAALYARLASWRAKGCDDDAEPSAECACAALEDQEAIEHFVDSLFTVFTVDNSSYLPLPYLPYLPYLPATHPPPTASYLPLPYLPYLPATHPPPTAKHAPLDASWLQAPSTLLTQFALVHRGPLSGGHLKLYLRAEGGALYLADMMKEASELIDRRLMTTDCP